jgi:hypothetical protein
MASRALGIAFGHDARSSTVGRAHAIAQHDDDVFNRAAAFGDFNNFEITVGGDHLSVALGGGGGQHMYARVIV